MPVMDCGMGGIPSGAAVAFGSIAMNGDEYVRCNRCGYGGCDVKVSGCGCTLHAVGFTPCSWYIVYVSRSSEDPMAERYLGSLQWPGLSESFMS